MIDNGVKLCNICPRNCNIDRFKLSGYCGAKGLKIALVMKHFWEEPIISGTNGSGAIFFSHCSLKCIYCQNYKISSGGLGKETTVEKLADLFKQLEQSGVHNINLVSPTHYTNEIVAALRVIPSSFETEASGGITIENVVEYAKTGVQFISIGALTHSAQSMDLSLKASFS